MTRALNRIARRKLGSFPGSVKPRIVSAVASGAGLAVTYSIAADISLDTVDLSRFAFTASGGALSWSFYVASGNQVIGNMSRDPDPGETVTMTYTPQGNASDLSVGTGPAKAYAKAQTVTVTGL